MSNLGLIGLAVMGQNLVLNLTDHGFSVSVFNRSSEVTKNFANSNASQQIFPAYTISEFVSSLEKPRKIILLIKAGNPVDLLIEQLLPHLKDDDIIIDGGNSNFNDTIRRSAQLSEKRIKFIGAGISGGEEGARNGPSIMPGGNVEAWGDVKQILQSISAKVEDGSPCCEWIGDGGAGHYVKMIHNGIEYGDMQLIAEAYHIMKDGLQLNNDEISEIFDKWNDGKLNSYLIEITRDIFRVREEGSGKHMIDVILDKAGQKGTGKWTVISALDLGIPVSLIGEAVFQRFLSSLKEERILAANRFKNERSPLIIEDKEQYLSMLENALYASKIISYSQGFSLMNSAAKKYGWKLNFGEIALMWRGGCIIRSSFLREIKLAFDNSPNLHNLILDEFFSNILIQTQKDWRKIVTDAINWTIPIPGLTAALTYFDGYTKEILPANLIQAQRDYFGAHTFKRMDDAEGSFHIDWIERSKEY